MTRRYGLVQEKKDVSGKKHELCLSEERFLYNYISTFDRWARTLMQAGFRDLQREDGGSVYVAQPNYSAHCHHIGS